MPEPKYSLTRITEISEKGILNMKRPAQDRPPDKKKVAHLLVNFALQAREAKKEMGAKKKSWHCIRYQAHDTVEIWNFDSEVKWNRVKNRGAAKK